MKAVAFVLETSPGSTVYCCITDGGSVAYVNQAYTPKFAKENALRFIPRGIDSVEWTDEPTKHEFYHRANMQNEENFGHRMFSNYFPKD